MADLIGHRNESESNPISSLAQTLLIKEGGGGDTTEGNSTATAGGISLIPNPSHSGTHSSNGFSKVPFQQQLQTQQHSDLKSPPTTLAKDSTSQKDGLDFVQDLKLPPSTDSPIYQLGPNELFFGGTDRASGLSYKDREERVRQLRERQQNERQQKLGELKEQAAAAHRFREQQEAARRQRLDEMRCKDSARRTQVEERKKLIQQAEQERRQAVLRKSAEREQRLEHKRRQERSNAVFAFGSSTPRMLDPRENVQNYFGARRATSTTNVNLSDSSSVRRASECQETDLSRKRATSAHSLNRKPDDPAEFGGEREPLPEQQAAPVPSSAAKPHRGVVADLRMSTSMYEVFNWGNADDDPSKSPLQPHSSRPGEDASTTRPLVAAPPPTAARRRTDLLPAFPSLRDSAATPSKGSPRHRSSGRALSLGRLDQLARPRPQRPPSLAPLHESPSSRERRMTPARTMSKSMSHLCPQRARTPIGQATDGAGVPVADGSLDRRSSRSSLALAQPRMMRAEMLRLSKLRRGITNAKGVRSGTVTPGSPSRPTSALSQTSAGSQTVLRSRASPRKPRPLSIAGSTLSSADKPREAVSLVASASLASPASPNRESRPIDRKSSTGSLTSKPTRAKSAGSDRSAPSTPAKTSRGTTPKRTPAQVKAESAAKKAAERSKPNAKLRSTPKTTPLQSPSAESKALPGSEKNAVSKSTPPPKEQKEEEKLNDAYAPSEVSDGFVEKADKEEQEEEAVVDDEGSEPETVVAVVGAKSVSEQLLKVEIVEEAESTAPKHDETNKVEEAKEQSVTDPKEEEKPDLHYTQATEEELQPSRPSQPCGEAKEELQSDKTQAAMAAQRAAEKPVTGYASEGEYKAALAEKRRQAREAKERELELERQREFEEEERERREEEEYLRLMEEQKKVEEERLKKAILEAGRQREEEALKKEEEEKQRLETEKIEQQKKVEAEEKMKKEEDDRQTRKSRVAAIMSRTRGKLAIAIPSKAELKTPSEESKTFSDGLMSTSMTENLINNISSSMTDSMIVQAIESHQSQKDPTPPPAQAAESKAPPLLLPQTGANESQVTAQTTTSSSATTLSSQSGSAVTTDFSSSQLLVDTTQTETRSLSSQVTTTTVTESRMVEEESKESAVELIPDVASINLLQETHINGNAAPPVPMDTTPTSQSMDLLGSINGVNGIGHNGMDSDSFQSPGRPDNQFGSLDPLNTPSQTILTSTTEAKSDSSSFDQIIDLNQTKLSNEDAVNSNPPPPPPIIAFEDNLNKKSQQQSQDTSSNVPDLLL